MAEATIADARQTNIPTYKTLAATGGSLAGGSLATIIIYLIEQHSGQLPVAVSGAVTVLIGTAVAFIAGWLTPHGDNEVVMAKEGKHKLVSGRRRRAHQR